MLLLLLPLTTLSAADITKVTVAITPLTDNATAQSDSVANGIARGLKYYKEKGIYSSVSVIDAKKVAKMMQKNNMSVRDLSDDQTLMHLGQLMNADLIAMAEIASDGSVVVKMMDVKTGGYLFVNANPFNSLASLGPAVQDIFYCEIYKTGEHCRNIGFVRNDVPIAVTNGLAGYWTFDDQTGKDVSDYENTSSIGGGKDKFTTNTPSGYGFACVENYLKVKEHLLNANTWTVCMWVYFPKKWNNVIQLFSEQIEKDNVNYFGYEAKITGPTSLKSNMDHRMYRQSDGNYKMEKDGFSLSGSMYKDSKTKEEFGEGWHHVTVMKMPPVDGRSAFLYFVDGINVHNRFFERNRQYEGDLFMGWHAPAYDNVRFYERMLLIDEIREIYKSEQQ